MEIQFDREKSVKNEQRTRYSKGTIARFDGGNKCAGTTGKPFHQATIVLDKFCRQNNSRSSDPRLIQKHGSLIKWLILKIAHVRFYLFQIGYS